jgi:asparaginyl-tRNA synthetase
MKRTRIAELLRRNETDIEVLVKGWVKTKRQSKKVAFVALNDGSTLHDLQGVLDLSLFDEELLKQVTTGASVALTGLLVPSQGQGQALELQVRKLELYGPAPPDTYPLQKKEHSLEFLRENAHLRMRTNTFGAVNRIRGGVAYAIHHFFHERGFVYLHTPIITGSDCEGAGQMFQVTTLDLERLPRIESGQVDYNLDFFEKPTHLTVSGQLSAELAALALGEVYTFGPTFRAENSNTTRHLAEFWMIEPEMAFYELEDNMELATDLLKFLIGFALEHHADDLAFLCERYDSGLLDRLRHTQASDFVRLDYSEAIDILSESKRNFEFAVSWGLDLQSEHERYLVEEHFARPVIVYNYPKDIKAFYMRLNDDGRTVRAMDILFPGIGEIVGGSQREERLDVLEQRIQEMGLPYANYWWYLDTRRYGTVPHSGFGLGFERLLLFLTGMGNIRDVIPFPRTPGNAEF